MINALDVVVTGGRMIPVIGRPVVTLTGVLVVSGTLVVSGNGFTCIVGVVVGRVVGLVVALVVA